jgi:tetratricopeptide (TPR) repeat protein
MQARTPIQFFTMKDCITGCVLVLFLWPLLGFPQQPSSEAQGEVQQGMEALKRGNFAAAEQHLSAALKIDPTLTEVRANLGLAYYAGHQYRQAISEFQEALRRDPGVGTAKSFLPLSLAAVGDCEEALSGLEREFASNSDVKLRRVLGLSLQRCALAAGKEPEADQVAQKLLAAYPDDPDVLFAAGQLYGRLSSETYLKLMKVAPNSARTYQVMASVAASEGNWKGAIDAYHQALKLEPTLQGAHLQIAVLMLTHAQEPDAWRQALTELNEELKVDPTSAQAQYEIGEVYRKHAQLEPAVAAFRRALQLDPAAVPARLGLAKALRQLDRKREALEALEPARESDDPGVHFLLAQIYRDLGQTDEAQQEEAKFKKLQPTP